VAVDGQDNGHMYDMHEARSIILITRTYIPCNAVVGRLSFAALFVDCFVWIVFRIVFVYISRHAPHGV
jgi:hypothetical protein